MEDILIIKSHVYNIKISNDVVYGRFCWFNKRFKGYMYFKIVDENTLIGGWLSKHSINVKDDGQLKYYMDEMDDHVLLKEDSQPKNKPEWVKEYEENRLFEKYQF